MSAEHPRRPIVTGVRLTAPQARERFANARVARLATVSAAGHPSLVPVVFALDGETIYTAVDRKPKTTTALRRLDNIAANPSVCLLVDHYDDDWTRLWWARADGTASVPALAGSDTDAAREALAQRYRQYRDDPPPGPVIVVRVSRWSGWVAR
jgi:PPOX class probable F420-dependent enzyme